MKQIVFLLIIFSLLSCIINNEEVLAFNSTNISIIPRIIGAGPATLSSYPYVGTVRYRGRTYCTATLVGNFDFIAPAHCFTHMKNVIWPYDYISVCAMSASPRKTGRIYYIGQISVHPGWTGVGNKVHDLAHIKVLNEVKYNVNLQKINLPLQNIQSNMKAWIVGWGYTEPNPGPDAEIYENLQQAVMWTLDYTDCQPFMPNQDIQLQKEQLCIYQVEGFGCSKADGGVPLAIGNEVLGILSWLPSENCAAGQPEIFVNIYMETDFLFPLIHGA